MSEGTATQAVVFLRVEGLAAAGCPVTGPVTFSIKYRGALARIQHNPITAKARPDEAWPNGVDVAHFWWANWCGARTQIVVDATYRGRTGSLRSSFIPTCIQPNRPSALYLPN